MKTEKNNNTSLVIKALAGNDLGITGDGSKPISQAAFAQALRVLYQGWRQGTVGCKGRAEVARSGKKPWKQKGTGRARAGDAKSPLWRGGGVTHGPQPRVQTLKIGKKVRQNVFAALLHKYVEGNRIHQVDGFDVSERPSTKKAVNLLQQLDALNKKVILFINQNDSAVLLSFANIKSVRVVYFDQPNVFDLARSEYWVHLKQDADNFKKMVQAWL